MFATGFDAMTGALLAIDIRGRDGVVAAGRRGPTGPRTYLGLGVAGFPNLFTITGPGSPSVLTQHDRVDRAARRLDRATASTYLRERGIAAIEATPEAEDAWVDHVNEVGDFTLYPPANSWYMGANVPGKPRVFMPYIGGVGVYREKCDEVARERLRGLRPDPGGRAGLSGWEPPGGGAAGATRRPARGRAVPTTG